MAENQSEVARLRQQIAEEYEAAQRGLTGVAQVGRHLFLNARMHKIADLIGQVREKVADPEEVRRLLNEL